MSDTGGGDVGGGEFGVGGDITDTHDLPIPPIYAGAGIHTHRIRKQDKHKDWCHRQGVLAENLGEAYYGCK